MAQEVYMDVPQVQKIADSFGKFGDTLKKVAKGLEAAIIILKASAFVGLVGNLAVASYLERIKPRVEKFEFTFNGIKLVFKSKPSFSIDGNTIYID